MNTGQNGQSEAKSAIPLFVQEQAAHYAGRIVSWTLGQPGHQWQDIRSLNDGQSVYSHGETGYGESYEILTSSRSPDSVTHRVTIKDKDGETVLLVCEFLDSLIAWRLFTFVPGPWVEKTFKGVLFL